MNSAILNTEIQEFINDNLKLDINTLILKGIKFQNIETIDVIEQIEAKIRCVKKLPTWFKTKNIYYPNKLNIEQTSSEITAKYKSELISGHSIIDLTGGFGVDCFYFSKRFNTVVYCEISDELTKIVTHNFNKLKIKNIKTKKTDGIEYLKNAPKIYDWIYIDPSRRHESKGKVFFLNDCLPNVSAHLDLLFEKSKNIMIKTSPLLDLSMGISELKYVKTIYIVAVNNEVKELLWILENSIKGDIGIETINIKKHKHESFNYLLENEKVTESKYKAPLSFLYEPNAAILKAGAFHSISNKLNVFKLHKHSHLYTSERLIEFPGRIFTIEKIIPFNKKEFKKLGLSKANITTRNFPETVKTIRKKWSITDGGHTYLFFTTDLNNNKIVVITSKIDQTKKLHLFS